MTAKPTPGVAPTPWEGGGVFLSEVGVAAARVIAASREDSRPQASLKFQPHNVFNYVQDPI